MNFCPDPAALRAACERLLPVAREFLHEIVSINSFTAHVAGVRENARRIAKRFEALGFHATNEAGPAGAGPHLFLSLPRIDQSAPTIVLLSHLDTVFPPEEEIRNDFRWRVEGDRIYGPGTNDIKGGTVLIWLLLAVLRETHLFSRANWMVALNACEEVDSAHFGAACAGHFPAATRACLIFEADGGEGDRFSVVAARKGRATFTIRVAGRGAHAGGGHARGANAIVQLSEVVQRAAALTDYARDLTVNVGTIRGGTVNNRVPHEAEATLEMRAFDPEVYRCAKRSILDLAGEGTIRSEDGPACRIEVSLDDETPPWPVNPGTERLVEIWRSAGVALGMRVAKEARGGLSDGNALWNQFPTLDGLGPRGDNAHCSEQSPDGSKEQEWVDAASFIPKTMLNACAIARLLESAD